MSVRIRTILKSWFLTGKYPTESQFADLIDSYVHKTEDKIEIDTVNGLQEALDSKQAINQVGNNNNQVEINNYPGTVLIVTEPISNFGLAIIKTSFETGAERVLHEFQITNEAILIKDSPSYEQESLDDYELTYGVVDDKVNLIITFASGPGPITIKKPQITYF